MFGKQFVGQVGASLLGSVAAPAAPASTDDANAISDGAILNFALNLEYLEAEFYLSAAAGILAVEAYHAANVRTVLYDKGLRKDADAISAAARRQRRDQHQRLTRTG